MLSYPSLRTPYNSRRSSSYRDKWNLTNARCDPVYPRPEIKYLDRPTGTIATPFLVNNAGTGEDAISTLNELAQGVLSTNRIGQQVAVKSVYYQFIFSLAPATTTCVVRYIIFWDRTPKGDKPDISDLLALSSSYVTAPLNLANRDRFVVLADDRIALSPYGEQTKFIDGYRKINQLSTYVDSTEAVKPLTGGLFVLFVSDVTSNFPRVYGNIRTRYMDN